MTLLPAAPSPVQRPGQHRGKDPDPSP